MGASLIQILSSLIIFQKSVHLWLNHFLQKVDKEFLSAIKKYKTLFYF